MFIEQDELARFMEGRGTSTTAMRFRKAAVKARHQKELNDMRNKIEKQIDQSLRDLRAASDFKRMQTLEAQVNLLFLHC